jgi:hypothetical protein
MLYNTRQLNKATQKLNRPNLSGVHHSTRSGHAAERYPGNPVSAKSTTGTARHALDVTFGAMGTIAGNSHPLSRVAPLSLLQSGAR